MTISTSSVILCELILNTENTEQSGSGIENGSEWSNETVKFSIGPRKEVNLESTSKGGLLWSQRLSFILSWQMLRRESLLSFFYWHEALKAEK